MKKNNIILEQILLNMKYDSKKTLSENSKYIFEGCIPLDTKLNSFVNNSNRSNEYPELGKWGDGTCKCTNNTKCLEFKKNCCGKPNMVQTGTLTQSFTDDSLKDENNNETIKEKAADGTELILPKTTKIDFKYGCSALAFKYSNEYELVKKDFPKFTKACQVKFQTKEGEELNNCVMNYFNSHIGNCIDNSVHSFTYDGVKYTSCFKIKTGGHYLNPEEITLSGYFAPSLSNFEDENGCKGKKWENFTTKSEEKYTTDIKQGQVIDDKLGRVSNKVRYYLSGYGQ